MNNMGKWSIRNKGAEKKRSDKPEWQPYWLTYPHNRATKESVEHMKNLLSERRLYLRFFYYHKHEWICQEAVNAIVTYLEGQADEYQERKFNHFVTNDRTKVYWTGGEAVYIH